MVTRGEILSAKAEIKNIQTNAIDPKTTRDNIIKLKELVNEFGKIWTTDSGNELRKKFNNIVDDLEATLPPTGSFNKMKTLPIETNFYTTGVTKKI